MTNAPDPDAASCKINDSTTYDLKQIRLEEAQAAKEEQIQLAKEKQESKRFKDVEDNLRLRCLQTGGKVKYIPPPPLEFDKNETYTRRISIRNELVPFMTREERQEHAIDYQNHGNFKRTELILKRRCDATLGGLFSVPYQSPLLWSWV